MTEQFYKHVQDNAELFNFWIERNERLQYSADVLKPLIEPFKAANPTVNIHGCQDCIIDMLIWAKIQLKNKPNKTKK